MGYRSTWMLVLNGKTSAVNEVMSFIHEEAGKDTDKSADLLYSGAWAFQVILKCRESPKVKGDETTEVFADNFTKCYGTWDEVIYAIRDKAEELGVRSAYARVGEEPGDEEEAGDPGFYVRVIKTLELLPPKDAQ